MGPPFDSSIFAYIDDDVDLTQEEVSDTMRCGPRQGV